MQGSRGWATVSTGRSPGEQEGLELRDEELAKCQTQQPRGRSQQPAVPENHQDSGEDARLGGRLAGEGRLRAGGAHGEGGLPALLGGGGSPMA